MEPMQVLEPPLAAIISKAPELHGADASAGVTLSAIISKELELYRADASAGATLSCHY